MMASAVFLQSYSSETDYSVNGQVRIWLLCDSYNGNPHGLWNLLAKLGFTKIKYWKSLLTCIVKYTSCENCTHAVYSIIVNTNVCVRVCTHAVWVCMRACMCVHVSTGQHMPHLQQWVTLSYKDCMTFHTCKTNCDVGQATPTHKLNM